MINKPIKIGIVDDHQIVIDGLKSLLQNHANFEVLLSHTKASAFLEQLKTIEVDIVITDIMMPDMDGQTLAKEIKKQFPKIKILALSMSGQGHLVNKMIADSDLVGYMLKNTGQAELHTALEKIAAGSVYFSPEILEDMIKDSETSATQKTVSLTGREIEIIRFIEKEMSNKEIAHRLFISERTVETHRKNIFRKLNTHSLVGLIKYAYEHNLILKN